MNILIHFFILLIVMINSCVAESSKVEIFPIDGALAEQCDEARQGELVIDTARNNTNPTTLSYLIDCAVSVIITDPNPVSGKSASPDSRLAKKQKKQLLTDTLLAKNFDIHYRNDYGDTLIMLVIFSYLAEDWKEKTIAYLIKQGVDINAENSNADTALTIAKFKQHDGIVKLLMNSGVAPLQ